jgi:uncharacterized membrane protein
MKTLLMLTLIVAAAFGTAAATEAVSVTAVDFPTTPGGWPNFAFSADGSRVAVYLDNVIYLLEDGIYTALGEGDPLNSQIGISADGTVIVSSQPDAQGIITPTIWREADGWAATHLGSLPGASPCDNSYGTGYACNEDGTMVAGLAWDGCDAVAFRWTAEEGMVNLGGVRASTISPSGTSIAGFAHNSGSGARLPAYWTLEADGSHSGPHMIGVEDAWGEVWGTSYDGLTLVGEYTDWTTNSQGFLYTEADGIRFLGTVEDDPSHASMANFLTLDGKVIGRSGTAGPWGIMKASIWREGEGMQYLEDYIAAHAADLPEGFTDGYIRWAPGISADGSIAVIQWMDDFWNTVYYWVEFSGTVAIEDHDQPDQPAAPSAMRLAQNFPNPFNPMTTIEFALPRTESVRLAIHDLSGRLVRTLVMGEVQAGDHSVVWDGTDARGNAVASGTYLYRLDTESVSRARTLTLLK